ncbi:thioredoxin-disulfide reductase [Clostridium pasteurianum]|uniref:Thioredoxin reductase n=1 Tax=Clostridium pasteurianum BC1 TaxID=86416 RepID=R4K9T5_CLOPA|nr:thioredoxin-disulfide reductase [Clostridium pasteurianum]AGK99333.1 thioredoxin-disulfide reductase [Clostridium pasteurianum BC1]
MKEEKQLDLVIIGAGPAGLTAAIYALRAKLNTIVLENGLVGGQIRETYTVENFPGFDFISGADLADNMEKHAKKVGADINEFGNIQKVKLTDDEKIIETDDIIYRTKAVIIATGAKARNLPIPEEEKLHGKVIHYCELCDGALYQGKDIVVVGGGNSAIEAAIFLTKYAKNITIVHQFDYFQAQKYSQDELFKHNNIKIIWNSEIRNIVGEDKIEKIIIENVETKEKSDLKADGVFVYIGYEPKTELFKDFININKWGYIETDENMETNIKGVFAAGDVRNKTIRQLTTAVNDGTIAALMAEKYIGGK